MISGSSASGLTSTMLCRNTSLACPGPAVQPGRRPAGFERGRRRVRGPRADAGQPFIDVQPCHRAQDGSAPVDRPFKQRDLGAQLLAALGVLVPDARQLVNPLTHSVFPRDRLSGKARELGERVSHRGNVEPGELGRGLVLKTRLSDHRLAFYCPGASGIGPCRRPASRDTGRGRSSGGIALRGAGAHRTTSRGRGSAWGYPASGGLHGGQGTRRPEAARGRRGPPVFPAAPVGGRGLVRVSSFAIRACGALTDRHSLPSTALTVRPLPRAPGCASDGARSRCSCRSPCSAAWWRSW